MKKRLEFILGKACSNVSEELRGRLVGNVLGGEDAVIIIPDQFNFETEKALYRAFAAANKTTFFPRVSVKTFSRLSDEIIETYEKRKKPAGDITKSILMYRAVNDVCEELESFKKIAKKPGFAAKMTQTVAMLKTAGITSAGLEERLSASGQSLAAIMEDLRDSNSQLFKKLSDISRIYAAFEVQMSRFSFTDRLDKTMTAAALAGERGFFKGRNVYFDGFSDFSLSQINFIESIIAHADSVTMAFTTEIGEDCRDIFTTLNTAIAHIAAYAEEQADCTVYGADRLLTENRRFKNPALAELSDGLFGAPSRSIPMEGINIVRAEDIHAEMDFVAAEIRRLTVLEKKMRYNEIAVLSASPAEYKAPIKTSFEKYEIPLFCDIPENILHTPLVNLLLSLLNALADFTVENVLSYIKTGFAMTSEKRLVSAQEINDFESYLYTWEISRPENLLTEFYGVGETDRIVPAAERIRKEIVMPLYELSRDIRKARGTEITERICGYLFGQAEIERAIELRCESSEEAERRHRAVWEKLLEILEALHQGLDEPVTISEYCHLVRDICSGASLSNPPRVIDAVLAGDIRRTRVNDVRAVFIVGAGYGAFPAAENIGGIFSEYETELLGESNIKIAKNRRERYCYERYLAYRTISTPAELLYLTYPLLNASCESIAPSEIIGQICDDYGIREKSASSSEYGDSFYCTSERAARQKFARYYYSASEERETLKKALEDTGSAAFVKRLNSMSAKRRTSHIHNVEPKTAAALFRAKTFSATSVEKLAKCSFRYFCDSGLRISERRKKNLSPLEVGNIVHYAMQAILTEYRSRMDEFIAKTRRELTAMARAALEEYRSVELPKNIKRSDRYEYLFNNLTTVIADVLTVLQVEFSGRDYRPVFFELEISDSSRSAEIPTAAYTEPLDAGSIPEITLSEGEGAPAEHSDSKPSSEAATPGGNSPGTERTNISTEPLCVKINDDLTVKLTGNVDRVDAFRDAQGKEYIRVVDYKTGKREFTVVNACYGISAQMLLYLHALCTANPELSPGGVSYLPSMTAEPATKRSAAFDLLMKGREQTGLFISTDATNEEIGKYRDTIYGFLGDVKRSDDDFIPKDRMTEEQYGKFINICIDKISGAIGALYGGCADAVPTVYTENKREYKSCSHCPYRSFCGYSEEHEKYAESDEEIDGIYGDDIGAKEAEQ